MSNPTSMTGRCRHCGAPIAYVLTARGFYMACDAATVKEPGQRYTGEQMPHSRTCAFMNARSSRKAERESLKKSQLVIDFGVPEAPAKPKKSGHSGLRPGRGR